MSIAGKRKTTIGKDHSGRERGLVPAGDPRALAVHHTPAASVGMKDRTHAGNIARDGAPKVHAAVPLHNSATPQQRALAGMGHATGAPDSNPGQNPLSAIPAGGKPFIGKAAQISPGQHDRSHDPLHGTALQDPKARKKHADGKHGYNVAVGRAILAEAFRASGEDQTGLRPVLPDSNK